MLIIHMSYHYELESYLIPTGLPSVAGVSPSQVVAGVRQSQDMMMDMLKNDGTPGQIGIRLSHAPSTS